MRKYRTLIIRYMVMLGICIVGVYVLAKQVESTNGVKLEAILISLLTCIITSIVIAIIEYKVSLVDLHNKVVVTKRTIKAHIDNGNLSKNTLLSILLDFNLFRSAYLPSIESDELVDVIGNCIVDNLSPASIENLKKVISR